MKQSLIIENDLPPSYYYHWDFNYFKNFKPYRTKGKLGFLKYLGNTRYITETNDFLLLKLVDYYKDLNNILTRILQGYRDEMFLRFAFRVSFFSNEERFKIFLSIWDDLFSNALERYIKEYHTTFDRSYGISYVSYFNMRFSSLLLFENTKTLLSINVCPTMFAKDVEKLPLSVNDLSDLPPEYPSTSYLEELIFQSFSPSQKAID